MLPAFRCKACGFLETCDHAGECAHPHACRVCGAGVSFDPKTGLKTVVPENWEILADAAPKRLKELGITEAAKHEGSPAIVTGRQVQVTAVDGPKTFDK